MATKALLYAALLHGILGLGHASLASQQHPVDGSGLLCQVAGSCQPCQNEAEAARHCQETGHYMLLECRRDQQAQSNNQIHLPWPLPDSVTQFEAAQGLIMVAVGGCRMGHDRFHAAAVDQLEEGRSAQLHEAVAGGLEHSHGSATSLPQSMGMQIGSDKSVEPLTMSQQPRRLGPGGATRKLLRKHSKEYEESRGDSNDSNRSSNIDFVETTDFAVSHTTMSSMSLFHFELVMLLVLGIALPVVYWRKIRVHHL